MRSFLRFFGFAVAVILMLSVLPARADVTWTNAGTGNWSVGSNWSGGNVPTSTDNADIYNGGTVTITKTGEMCYILSLGGSGNILMTGGSLATYVMRVETGYFTQSGGTNTNSEEVIVGYGSSGTYNLQGGVLNAGLEGIAVGNDGVGDFIQTGGICNGLPSISSLGTYDLRGGLLNTSFGGISDYSGTFTQSGGTASLGNYGESAWGAAAIARCVISTRG